MDIHKSQNKKYKLYNKAINKWILWFKISEDNYNKVNKINKIK